jgi:hypothetical protein
VAGILFSIVFVGESDFPLVSYTWDSLRNIFNNKTIFFNVPWGILERDKAGKTFTKFGEFESLAGEKDFPLCLSRL